MKSLLCAIVLACGYQPTSAQEWVRQHPFAGFAPLYAVTFDDQGNGWAVGRQSLIIHTSDWGNVWSVQGGLPIGYSFQTVEIVPGTNSQTVLVGGPGLFITRNGGQTWGFASVGQSIDAVIRVQAFDEQQWVIYGINVGAWTDDGGKNWTVFDMPTGNTSAGWFNDLNNGWASGGPFDEHQLYKTSNSGTDWELADDAIYPFITDVQMVDANIGYLSARDFMYKTTNGGADWVKLHDDAQPSLTRMHVVNEQIVWSGLNNGLLFYTLNGGTTWTQTNPNVITSNSIRDVFATADGRVWAPGKYASVTHSMDHGQNWADQTPGKKNTLLDVEFDGTTGFACGSEGFILRTRNDGIVWEDVSLNDLNYHAIAIANDGGQRHVFAGSSNGTLVHSTDDGENWDIVTENLNQFYALHAINSQHLLMGASNKIMRSSNGGVTWNEVASTGNLVSEITFTDAQTGFAAINDGRVLKSTDGGMSWAPVLERTNYRFAGVYLDGLSAWAVAEFIDSAFSTQDGGATWTSHKLPYNTFWQDVAFMDADTGYISGGSGGSGYILRTTDGGLSWELTYNETESLNSTFVRPGEDYVWTVGYGGNILHFSPCAVAPEISNLTGETEPCEGSIAVYEVESDGATIFTWTIPSGWVIQGSDNSSRIEVLVGNAIGNISIQAGNSCGATTEALELNVDPRTTQEVQISESNGILSTSLDNVMYQWLKNGIPIGGAIDQSFMPAESGMYGLIVTFPNGCTRNSNTIDITISGIREVHTQFMMILPNPASESITIQVGASEHIHTVELYNTDGRLVYRSIQHTGASVLVEIAQLANGIYIAFARTDQGIATGKFIKN
jgi:photosystem II stability/assembly factor-like uncharacterized protein